MKLTVGQFLMFLILIVAIAAGAFYGTNMIKEKSGGKIRQAIFLTNGQVYFGEISKTNSKWIELKDIYYLQVQQPLQQKDPKEQQQPQISLVKLGNELHGPVDKMKINRDHILFYEDMKDESKVNDAIRDFIKSGGATAAPTPAPSPTK